MSVLFNIADKITFGTEPPDYLTFRKRVLDDDGVILDDEQLREDMLWVWQNKPTWFGSAAVSKVGKLYGTTLDGTVVRNTVKTGVNNNNLLDERVVNERPWTYVNGRIADLVESSATNFIPFSEDYTQAGWNTTRVQVFKETSETPDPFGTFKANRIRVSLSGSPARLFYSFSQSGISGSLFNVSSFVKPKNTDKVTFRISNSGEDKGAEIIYTFSTQEFVITFLDTSPADPSEPINNYINTSKILVEFNSETGWYKFSFGGRVALGQSVIRFSCGTPGGSTVILNDEIYNYGASINLNIDDSNSFIRTTGSTLTRNADVLSVDGASGAIGQTQGTLYAHVNIKNISETTGIILAIYFGSNNFIRLQKMINKRLQAFSFRTNPNSIVNLLTPINSLTEGNYKLAFAYEDNNFAFYVNGTQIGTSSDKIVGGPYVSIYLGHFEGNDQFNDSIYKSALFATRLSNATLQEMTSL